MIYGGARKNLAHQININFKLSSFTPFLGRRTPTGPPNGTLQKWCSRLGGLHKGAPTGPHPDFHRTPPTGPFILRRAKNTCFFDPPKGAGKRGGEQGLEKGPPDPPPDVNPMAICQLETQRPERGHRTPPRRTPPKMPTGPPPPDPPSKRPAPTRGFPRATIY